MKKEKLRACRDRDLHAALAFNCRMVFGEPRWCRRRASGRLTVWRESSTHCLNAAKGKVENRKERARMVPGGRKAGVRGRHSF